MERVAYLADTNIVSEMMRPKPNNAVQTAWQIHDHESAISAVSWHELLAGTLRLPPSKRRTAFENFLNTYLQKQVAILPYNQAAAEWHAEERTRLMKIGKTPSFPDGQIAAVAATNTNEVSKDENASTSRRLLARKKCKRKCGTFKGRIKCL